MAESESEAARLDAVVELWRGAFVRPLHGAFCACCAGMGGLALSPDGLEQDVLDYLLQRYDGQPGGEALAEVVRQRAQRADGNFVAWLGTLNEALAPDDRRRLMDDVTAVLRSIAGHQPVG
jgi:hypothetical protein